jgi:hypothetical protein
MKCHTCGRSFNPVTLAKHSKVCEKVFVKKRKAFNTAAQREATDASGKGIDKDPFAYKPPPAKKHAPEKPKSSIPKWKL